MNFIISFIAVLISLAFAIGDEALANPRTVFMLITLMLLLVVIWEFL